MTATADTPASVPAERQHAAPPTGMARHVRRVARAALVVLATLALIILLGYLAVPPLLKSKLEETLSSELHRQTTVERVAFNPFTLAATFDNVAVRNRDADTPLLAIGQIVADMSAQSLWHRAPVVDALVVRGPRLSLVRNADGRYNVQDLIDAYFESPPGPPPQFSLNNIEVVDGALTFDDRTVNRVHNVEALRVGIPFLSSFPYDTKIRVVPRLAARVDGAGFDLSGETTPFAEAQVASINIALDGLSLPVLLDYVSLPLKVRIPSGVLSTQLKLSFVGGDAASRALLVSGEVALAKLAIERPDGGTLIGVPDLKMSLGTVDVFRRAIDVTRVAVTGPQFDVRRGADGSFEWAAILAGAAPAAPATAAAAPRAAAATPGAAATSPGSAAAPSSPAAPPAWRARIREIEVHDGKAHLADQSTSPVFQSTLSEIEVHATDLANTAGEKGQVTLAFNTDLGATVKGEATLTLSPVGASGKLATNGINLRRLYPYYQSAINLEVTDGTIDFDTAFALTPKDNGPPALTIAGGAAEVRNLRLNFPRERQPLWAVPKLEAKGIEADVDARRVTIDETSIRQAVLRIRRDKDGRFNFARIMRTAAETGRTVAPGAAAPAGSSAAQAAPAPAASGAAGASGAAAATPAPPRRGAPASGGGGAAPSGDDTWHLLLRKSVYDRATVEFQDHVPATPVRLRFTDLDLRVDSFSNGRASRSTVALRTRVGDGGRVAFSGGLGTNPFTANWHVDAQGVALAPLQPYLDDIVNLTVTGGAATVNGDVLVDTTEADNVRAAYAGDVVVTDFAALDKPTSSDLVRWKRLALTRVDAANAPQKLGIGAIAIDDFFARVIIYPDGSLNLLRLGAKDAPEGAAAPEAPAGATPAGATRAATTPAAPPAAAARAPAPPITGATTPGGATTSVAPRRAESLEAWPVTIGPVTIANGDVQFSDLFIKPNYSAHLTELKGSVSAMSKTQAGEVAIAGLVEHTAPVDIQGRINPFATELDLDITGKARGVDLPPLSPYAAKYAGYGIEKGKLSFDVHYRIENRKLVADNKLVLDQLTFGPKVESPTATKLPVLLAVALLKDRNGVIDIDLPISGSLDDPQFSVGGLIIRVIVNLITKAVTAPFALLGAIFGGGEQLSYVEFAPGSAVLGPPAEAKLKTLAKALTDRPALKLDITGRADATSDADGLRQAELDRAVKAQKRKALAAQQAEVPALDAIKVEADEYPRYLERAYAEARFDKPRNAIGFTKSLPPAEMEALFRQNAKVDDEALRVLAMQRAQTVMSWLTKEGGIPSDRVFLLAPNPSAAPPTDGKPNRVDFALH